MRARGLDDRGKCLPAKKRPPCNARTRAGGFCTIRVMPGNERCRFHGGKSTGPRTAEGRARIVEAQRNRWNKWKERRKT
ncbi:HGGxSTG domain-containing protein [Thioclava sp. FR2]|uniref:HGGxSTG domain-containing protein n=1 Tax=Thioclava sp. FR2 TaxID=3445780 RepID=UPI003EBD4260